MWSLHVLLFGTFFTAYVPIALASSGCLNSSRRQFGDFSCSSTGGSSWLATVWPGPVQELHDLRQQLSKVRADR